MKRLPLCERAAFFVPQNRDLKSRSFFMRRGIFGFDIWFYGIVALLLAVCQQPLVLGGLMLFVMLVEKDEIGMGCDIYLPFFKLIPELKFCFGLANILQKNRTDLVDKNLMKFSNALDDASAKMIVLTLYFE